MKRLSALQIAILKGIASGDDSYRYLPGFRNQCFAPLYRAGLIEYNDAKWSNELTAAGRAAIEGR